MWSDILMILYIVLLFPLANKCEKMKQNGFKCLIIGVIFTPIAGFIYKYYEDNNRLPQH